MVISSEWTSAGVNPRMTPVPIVCTAYTLCIIQAHSSRGGYPTLQVCKTRAGTNAAIKPVFLKHMIRDLYIIIKGMCMDK